MSEEEKEFGPIEEARKMGITDEELGIAQPDLDFHLPDEETVADRQEAANQEPIKDRNSFPIPPGTPAKIAKCFKMVPHEQVSRIKDFYDTFENKDLPFCEFVVELVFMCNAQAMQNDLANIVEQKRAGLQRQAIVDHAVKKKDEN
jgi:hypothetical protein